MWMADAEEMATAKQSVPLPPIKNCEGEKKLWRMNERLSEYKPATNQRAKLTAIILGLKLALDRYENLRSCPELRVTIHSDTRYAVNCMNIWIYKWASNGWANSRGGDVANQDLIREASSLEDDVKELGSVRYVWIPRSKNELADKYCNQEMDDMEAENKQLDRYYTQFKIENERAERLYRQQMDALVDEVEAFNARYHDYSSDSDWY